MADHVQTGTKKAVRSEPKPPKPAPAKSPAKPPAKVMALKPPVAGAKKAPKAHRPKLTTGPGVNLYALDGTIVRSVDLPHVFHGALRPDLIRRAVTAARANRRQAYGSMYNAGRRHSVRWSGKGQGVSRTPRIRGTMIGAQAPNTVGGARAHPPRPEKVWAKKVNRRELRIARAAALSALKEPDLVRARGHRFDSKLTLPVVVEDSIEAALPKVKVGNRSEWRPAKAALQLLEALGVAEDVHRAQTGTHVRAGRGKMRGRRWREPRGPLLVVAKPEETRRHFANLPGVEVRAVAQLDVEVLAPGGESGRLTIFSESALKALQGL